MTRHSAFLSVNGVLVNVTKIVTVEPRPAFMDTPEGVWISLSADQEGQFGVFAPGLTVKDVTMAIVAGVTIAVVERGGPLG